jgi:hypothetical protein
MVLKRRVGQRDPGRRGQIQRADLPESAMRVIHSRSGCWALAGDSLAPTIAPAMVYGPTRTWIRAPLSVSSWALNGWRSPNWNGNSASPFGQRLAGIVVAHAGHLCAGGIPDGQGFQDVVHLGRAEVEPGRIAGLEIARALEIANAVFVENHLADGQVGRRRVCEQCQGKQLCELHGASHSMV